jgi:ribosomal-protein-alanine N-acetyltransferase
MFIRVRTTQKFERTEDEMKHTGTLTLETKRLLLRRYELDDAEAVYTNWANDPEVTKYLTWQPHERVQVTKEVLTEWIKRYDNDDFYQWAIILKDLNQPIGSISVVGSNDEVKQVHIGYCIGRTWWHNAYTTEALNEVVRFFFEVVGVNRIDARHDTRNPNSGKVMKKSGLKYEGTLRQADINNSGCCDVSYYSILASDYFRLIFAPLDVYKNHDFLVRAHKETSRLTYGAPLDDKQIEYEIKREKDKSVGAYLDGKLVGICDVETRINSSEAYGWVHFFYLVPQLRNRRLGQQLVECALTYCHERNLPCLRLRVGKPNDSAYRFYERNGFIRDPEFDQPGTFGFLRLT